MQLETLGVASQYKGQDIGSWLFAQATLDAKAHGVFTIQLTTNTKRPQTNHFHEKLGFEASHERMGFYLNKHNEH